jgi:CubicO group peptidase (beta-lactamase class C family)
MPVERGTRFRVGSITKTFTGTAIVALRDEGALRLDDPLVAHLPEFAAVRNPWGPIEEVTLRRLLTHEAGLPSEAPVLDWATERFPSIEEIVGGFDHLELSVAPDSRAKYSNLGYQLLGEVIARVSGASYRACIAERILDPLGMRDSGFEGELPEGGALASGHFPRSFSDVPPISPARMKGTDAEGGLISTVPDLARWASLQFRTDAAKAGGPQVLAGRSLAEMHRPRRIVDEGWTEAQGLAWYCTRTGTGIAVGHAGGTFGFKSRLVFDPAARVAAIVLANGEGPAGSLALELLGIAAGAVRDVELRTPRPPVPTPERMRPFLGLYVWEDLGEPVRVVWNEGALAVVWAFGEPPVALDPAGEEDAFVVRSGPDAGERCTFRRGPDGAVTGMRISGWPLSRLLPAE